ncbi:probable inactive heme oxygenase 2, chloroplastic [Juglans microcarpa x Juglans regia]|uniref:probable inactive heme oxygenase 2, chloroplastic n=1 Tax=Juglans microcarpa x Juglans regia TaxID=2249226 RepID=UPI001B7F52F8|nr:probable inactive heme oxygenase 2, chloroplastic [Juglans microcarpa x Juglans regia]
MGTGRALILCCSDSSSISSSSSPSPAIATTSAPLVKRRSKRYRRLYPGESKGITEEMRFVAMRLRRVNKGSSDDDDQDSSSEDGKEGEGNLASVDDDGGVGGATWEPTLDGYLKYLVDSKLVFDTMERIVDESSDVAYAYFRKTGLERSEGLAKDLEWIRQQGFVILEPSNPRVSQAKYLNELAVKSAPLFLCHFYNIYFSHIAGGQVIARQDPEELCGKNIQTQDSVDILCGLRVLPIGGTITDVQKTGDFAISGFELSREVSFLVTMGSAAIIQVAKGALV